jgi:phosphoribosylaminoimidazole carboxylase (NCAIR synthetase)
MVARSRSGETRAFPVVETVQRDSICHVTEAPAQVSEAARNAATRIAESAVATLEGGPCLTLYAGTTLCSHLLGPFFSSLSSMTAAW